jgi:hypothetical protein
VRYSIEYNVVCWGLRSSFRRQPWLGRLWNWWGSLVARLLTFLPRLGNDAQLLHHTQVVGAASLLDYLCALYAVYGDAPNVYLLVGAA